jgi:hypothetical protein
MEERLPLLNHTPTRSVRRRNTLVAALALALIALSLLAADARSGFAYSTSLRGSIVSFPNGDLKTITVRFHSKFMVHFRRELPLQSLHPHACPFNLFTRTQDMIQRASMGNFTAPSMKPGG